MKAKLGTLGKSLLGLILILCSGLIYGQEIEGKIIDQSGEPIVFAAVLVKETGGRILSDEEGRFIISEVQLPVTLKVSALGFLDRTLEVTYGAQAQEIVMTPLAERLGEVILESTLLPAAVRETPASVGILTPQMLGRTDQTNILQSINTVPGVYVHQGALNTNKLSIRGIGSRSQYSTNRVKAYFEGIPLSTAEGETTLDDLDQEMVEKVEILKGPTSSIYGSGLGGVINLYAREAQPGETRAGIRSTFGSYGLQKYTLSAALGSENTQLLAMYNHLQSDSFRDNGNYDRKSLTFHAGFRGSDSGKFTLIGNFIRLKAYIPSSIDWEQLQTAPEKAAFTWGASKGYESYDKGMLGASYKHQFSPSLDNQTSVFLNFRDAYEPRPFDILKEEQVATGVRTRFNYTHRFLEREASLSLGSEYYQEWYDTGTFENLYQEFPGQGSIAGNALSNNSQMRHYFNVFAQWKVEASDRLSLEAGLNLNSTSYGLTDLFYGDEIDQTGDYRFETILSPRLGAVYNLGTDNMLFASVSHGFSTPGVAETLTPDGLINTDLQPEVGINYEIGHKGTWLDNRFYTELALYSIQVDKLLVAERVAEDQYVGRNLGKTDHNGLELLMAYRLDVNGWLRISPFVNASFNKFKFDQYVDDGVDYSGNELPGVPKRTINAGVDIKTREGLGVFANFQHNGSIPLDDANSRYNQAYNLVHLKAQYTLDLFDGIELDLFAGVNNLFNKSYASSVLPNAVGFGNSQPRYYYPGEPRNYYLGVGLDYLF